MKELICIVCPRGCHISVGDGPSYPVSGNNCPRGALYGREEAVSPKRTVTATCPAVLSGAASALSAVRRVPVKTTSGISRAHVGELVSLLMKTRVSLPVRAGDIIIKNWDGSGVDVIATRDLG